MTVDEMVELKKKNGYSLEYISEKSGVPLSTVQKVFSGITPTPRRSTLEALSKAFSGVYSTGDPTRRSLMLNETTTPYGNVSGTSALDLSGTGKTLDDYLALPDDIRVEMIDGVFYLMSAPTSFHQIISLEIAALLREYIFKNNGSCMAFIAPTDVQLDCDDKTMVQPDVFVVCNRDKINKARIYGAPDLIVEVLSESNWYHDVFRKKAKYQKAGVREYWVVMPEQKLIQVYNFATSDIYTEYTFDDVIPVNTWDGKCKVDFKHIYEKIAFLMN
ncbi:MAG: Uma2 family endonuclease [Lachnospiraceae bacterium]|nr:Uma2 family endonuclease [Lachnospiraceae bacterium]